MKLIMSSFITRPSLPVAGTFAKFMPCFLAMLRTAGVASAFSFDAATLARFVSTLHSSSVSDDDDDEDSATLMAAVYVVVLDASALVGVACVMGVGLTSSSSTSISTNALPTGAISSF